jgi:hypothetical protein
VVTVQAILPDGGIDPNYPRPRMHATEPDRHSRIMSRAA